ncbi:UNVERIFIED_CONTAM: hypothetical protein ABIC26_002996 [Paenibacillus sp. PvR008]
MNYGLYMELLKQYKPGVYIIMEAAQEHQMAESKRLHRGPSLSGSEGARSTHKVILFFHIRELFRRLGSVYFSKSLFFSFI